MDDRPVTLSEIKTACFVLMQADLTATHFAILASLQGGDIRMTALAQMCGFTTGNATGVVDYLQRKGLVERTHSAEDRREVLVRLTDAGADKIKSITDQPQ